MFSSPKPSGDAADALSTDILLDINKDDLRLFLDFMTQEKLSSLTKIRWGQMERLVAFSRQFECNHIIERIAAYLMERTAIAPWKIFCLASHLDHVSLAKAALMAMPTDALRNTIQLGSLRTNVASQCKLSYLLGVLYVSVQIPWLLDD
jgi:hypothetical protein